MRITNHLEVLRSIDERGNDVGGGVSTYQLDRSGSSEVTTEWVGADCLVEYCDRENNYVLRIVESGIYTAIYVNGDALGVIFHRSNGELVNMTFSLVHNLVVASTLNKLNLTDQAIRQINEAIKSGVFVSVALVPNEEGYRFGFVESSTAGINLVGSPEPELNPIGVIGDEYIARYSGQTVFDGVAYSASMGRDYFDVELTSGGRAIKLSFSKLLPLELLRKNGAYSGSQIEKIVESVMGGFLSLMAPGDQRGIVSRK